MESISFFTLIIMNKNLFFSPGAVYLVRRFSALISLKNVLTLIYFYLPLGLILFTFLNA